MQRLLRASLQASGAPFRLASRSLHASLPPLYAVRPAPHTVAYKTEPTTEDTQIEISTIADQIDGKVKNGEEGMFGNHSFLLSNA